MRQLIAFFALVFSMTGISYGQVVILNYRVCVDPDNEIKDSCPNLETNTLCPVGSCIVSASGGCGVQDFGYTGSHGSETFFMNPAALYNGKGKTEPNIVVCFSRTPCLCTLYTSGFRYCLSGTVVEYKLIDYTANNVGCMGPDE